MQKLMFDTNIFNDILDGAVDISLLKGRAEQFVTHIQLDEIMATKNLARRNQLLEVFRSVTQSTVSTESTVLDVSRLDFCKLGSAKKIPTETMLWDESPWGEAKWSADGGLYEPIKATLDKKNGGKSNNQQDALIGETCILNSITLVTHDEHLAEVVSIFGGTSTDFHSLLL